MLSGVYAGIYIYIYFFFFIFNFQNLGRCQIHLTSIVTFFRSQWLNPRLEHNWAYLHMEVFGTDEQENSAVM